MGTNRKELMNRKICAITLIYIIVIMGLYKMGIVLFDVSFNEDIRKEVTILEYVKDTDYMNVYKAKIKNNNVLLYLKKQKDRKIKKFEIGDVILIEGKFKEPNTQRNYGGFNYKMYLRSKNIYGSINVEEYKKIKCKKGLKWTIKRYINRVRCNIINLFDNKLSKKSASLLRGLIVGDKSDIEDEVLENFRKASLSHILAISGAHFSYIVLILNYINKKIKIKNLGNIVSILIMLFFMELTGCTTSVCRAGIMNIIVILSKLLHRKVEFWTNLSFSLLLQMIINPYVIFDTGLQLSYLGVIGIVTLYDKVLKCLKFKIISVTIAANIIIIPIMMYNFNTLSFSFIISNIFASFLLGPIIILGIISIFFRFKIIFFFLNLLLSLLIKIAEKCGSISFLNINVITPSIISLGIYYFLIYVIFYVLKNNKENKGNKKNKKDNEKNRNNRTKGNNKKIISILICLIIIFNLNFEVIISNIKQELLINFVDVSQGDCTLISYNGKNIIIDGGGSTDKNNNVGKNTLLPYLLDRKIKQIDYLIISHFDSDHVQGLMYIMDKIKIKNIIIGVQKENYSNYIKFNKLLEKNKNKDNNKVKIMQIENEINIDKLKLSCIWPNSNKLIDENSINNNSLVLKLIYGKFSMLFTGDIEKIAEKEIIREYKGREECLKSTILKVAHHGSKTSTIEDFLRVVSPKIALIGVGKDNKFGHPNYETIEKLVKQRIEIYRTDEMGEISIKVNNKGKIKVKKLIK